MICSELNVIHLASRKDRKESLVKELQQQGISKVKIWHGIIDLNNRAKGVAQAHQ